MKVFCYIILLSIAYAIYGCRNQAQVKSSTDYEKELKEMFIALERDSILKSIIITIGDPETVLRDYKKRSLKSDSLWACQQKSLNKIKNLGSTKRLEIIPIVEAFSNNNFMQTENAVSYLIKTDSSTILFDLGANWEQKNPATISFNMNYLGIKLEDIDDIVISHNHFDHNGGVNEEEETFSIGNGQPSLDRIKIYTPEPMKYLSSKPIFNSDPIKIERAVSTTGVIQSQIFFGEIEEQSLIMNVEGKGLVIISGCGHQTIKKIIDRTETLFDEPIYGIIGGFHLPMTIQENITPMYKYYVTGKLPWQTLTAEDIQENIKILKNKNIKIISISRHDTSLESINMFKKAFPDEFVELLVGKTIKI
jgi:7,8-dihydropterin-6-yl-methyl-4-(beta-D-ribofuranosyl)aminobenzene 5'-phosphate synthase